MGYSLFTAFFIVTAISYGFNVGTNLWLTNWSNQARKNVTNNTIDNEFYLGIYAAIGLCQGTIMLSYNNVTIAFKNVYYCIINLSLSLF